MNSINELHVIFGTGPLGLSVMRELVARGIQVRMINRSGLADVPAGVEVVACDAYDPEKTRTVTEGATVVYQCAQPAYNKWTEQFLPLQRSIISGVIANGARLVLGENTYMYGDVDEPVHEDLPHNAHTRKGKVRMQMTEEAIQAHRGGLLCVAMVRGSDFYGPAVLGSSFGERTIYPMLAGKAAEAIGNPDVPHSYTFINDFGTAMVMVGQDESAFGEAWHVPNAPALSMREMLQIAFDYIGMEPKISVVNKWMMRMGGLFVPEAREMVEMFYEFEKPFIVDGSKFTEYFGLQPTPLIDGIHQTIDWYRANPAH